MQALARLLYLPLALLTLASIGALGGCVRQQSTRPTPADRALRPDIHFLLKTGQLTYVVTAEEFADAGKRLALGIKFESVGPRLDPTPLPFDALAQGRVKLEADQFGSFRRFEDSGGDSAASNALQSRVIADRPDEFLTIRRGRDAQGEAITIYDVRKIAETDGYFKDKISYGPHSQRGLDDLVADLRKDKQDASSLFRERERFSFKVAAADVDPYIIMGRIKSEFGSLYQVRQLAKNKFEIRRSADGIVVHIGENGHKAQTIAPTALQRSLLEADFLLAGNSHIFLAPPGIIDQAKVLGSGLYTKVEQLRLDSAEVTAAEVHLMVGRRTLVPYLVTRKEMPAQPMGTLANNLQLRNSPDALLATVEANTQAMLNGTLYNPRNWSQVGANATMLGKGAWGEVFRVEYEGMAVARKVMSEVLLSDAATEVSWAIQLGEAGIGPKIFRAEADSTQQQVVYHMLLADGDAMHVPMNQKHILSYARKSVEMRKLGFLSFDDKPENVLIKGDDAFLNDFGYVRRIEEGVVQPPAFFGTFVPFEGRLAAGGPRALEGYSAQQTQAFSFAFNVLTNRLTTSGQSIMDDALMAPGVIQQIASRLVVDGDKLAGLLQSQRAASGLKPAAFDFLLTMIGNNPAKRRTIDAFLKRFSQESLMEP